ncbi:MAG: ABC transporter ATP-binding protein [Candidatus Sumerlaeota bacterium]|nr:ABC transporter ATP-binding protein [Candidatus Sumerlaeota bacterium]
MAFRRPENLTGARLTSDQSALQLPDLKLFLRFFPFCFPYKWKIILQLLCIAVSVPLVEVSAFLVRYQTDEVVLNDTLPLTRAMYLFLVVIGIQVGLWLLSWVFQIIREVMSVYVNMKVTLALKISFYEHMQRLSLGFFRSRPVGEHMFRAEDDIRAGRAGVLTMIVQLIPRLLETSYRLAWAAALLVGVDWKITALLLFYAGPYSVIAIWLYSLLRRFLYRQKLRQQEMQASLVDGVAGARTVKGLGRTGYQLWKYTKTIVAERRANLRFWFMDLLTQQVCLWALAFLIDQGLWIYVAYQTMLGNLTIGEFTVTFTLVSMFKTPLENLIKELQNARLQLVPAARLLQTFDVDVEVVDAPGAKNMPKVKGRIEFRNVTFSHKAGRPILDHVSFTIKPGERVAFVGPSGCGKSTVLNLIMRLYDPQQGQVLIDGIDLKTVSQLTLQKQIGVVLQETYVFGGTVGHNIRYGNFKATQAEVEEAARIADLHDFISSHPMGYKLDAGEGLKLSGGQKQRLGIARAMARDPHIILLDEPTAALDSHVEAQVLQTLSKATRGRTTVFIPHRLVTARDVDRIYVLDKGKIVQVGRHEELIQVEGLYRSIWLNEQHKDAEQAPDETNP